MNKEDIKARRKESIKKEPFLFRLLIMLGAVRYKVTYDEFHGFRKTYKVRIWHPFVWVLLILIFICNIPKMFLDLFKNLKDEFKEQTYYC